MNVKFEELPRRIFFDTNIIQDILEFDIANEENYSIGIKLLTHHSKKANDLDCLTYINLCNIRGAFQFIISDSILNELIESKKERLIRYGFEFLDYSNQFLFEYTAVIDSLNSFKHQNSTIL